MNETNNTHKQLVRPAVAERLTAHVQVSVELDGREGRRRLVGTGAGAPPPPPNEFPFSLSLLMIWLLHFPMRADSYVSSSPYALSTHYIEGSSYSLPPSLMDHTRSCKTISYLKKKKSILIPHST